MKKIKVFLSDFWRENTKQRLNVEIKPIKKTKENALNAWQCKTTVVYYNHSQGIDELGKRKEKHMQGMTNEQFNKVLEMIITIIELSKSKEEAIKEIKKLLKK